MPPAAHFHSSHGINPDESGFVSHPLPRVMSSTRGTVGLSYRTTPIRMTPTVAGPQPPQPPPAANTPGSLCSSTQAPTPARRPSMNAAHCVVVFRNSLEISWFTWSTSMLSEMRPRAFSTQFSCLPPPVRPAMLTGGLVQLVLVSCWTFPPKKQNTGGRQKRRWHRLPDQSTLVWWTTHVREHCTMGRVLPQVSRIIDWHYVIMMFAV